MWATVFNTELPTNTMKLGPNGPKYRLNELTAVETKLFVYYCNKQQKAKD